MKLARVASPGAWVRIWVVSPLESILTLLFSVRTPSPSLDWMLMPAMRTLALSPRVSI